MATDLDIYRSAAVLIRQFGSQALAEAERRARSMAKMKDREGQQVWERIAEAVRELQQRSPGSKDRLH